MAVLTDRQSVAANSTVANALSGKTQEFLQRPSLLRFGLTAAAVGMFVTVLVGDTVLMEDQEVSAQNRIPIDPDDFLVEGAGLPGDRVVVKLRNSTAGAIVAFTAVKINPVS